MESQGWWDSSAEETLKANLKADVMKAFKRAEKMSRCELGELFTDVYGGEEPWNIVRAYSLTRNETCSDAHHALLQKEQRTELTGLLKKYGDAWGPWKSELAKFKNGGQDLIDDTRTSN